MRSDDTPLGYSSGGGWNDMAPQYLSVINLQTGIRVDSYRSEITDSKLSEQIAVIDRSLDAGPSLPVFTHAFEHGWLTVDPGSTARKLKAVIWYGDKGKRLPALTIGLAMRRWKESFKLWGDLLDTRQPIAWEERREPFAPWLAVRRESAWDQLPPELAAEYDKYPAVLGWAWIERGKPATGMP